MFENLSPNMKAAIFTGVITVALAVIGGGGTWLYNIGFNNGARDIARVDAYKDQVDSLVKDLHAIGGSVHQTAQMIEDNGRLAKEVADAALENKRLVAEADQESKRLTKTIQNLEQKLGEQTRSADEQRKRADALTAEIASIFPAEAEHVTVAESHAEQAIRNTITIGVRDIYGQNSFIDMTASSDQQTVDGNMKAGDRKEIAVAGRRCIVQLMSIEKPNCNFMVTCNKAQ